MLTRTAVRAFSTASLKVVNNVAKQRFQISMPNQDAVLEYNKAGKHITLVRTEVPEVFKGKGVGKLLAKYAFNYALENKLDVTCQCHFLAHFYEKHKKDYEALKITFELDEEEEVKK